MPTSACSLIERFVWTQGCLTHCQCEVRSLYLLGSPRRLFETSAKPFELQVNSNSKSTKLMHWSIAVAYTVLCGNSGRRRQIWTLQWSSRRRPANDWGWRMHSGNVQKLSWQLRTVISLSPPET